ncbi:MAG: hypothetical protein Q4B04_02965 [bacterium]|nr:hypothetical protein [bacterium]
MVEKLKKLSIKNIVALSCLCLLILLIWILPLKSANVSVQLLTDNRDSLGSNVTVNILCESAYDQLYTFDVDIINGTATFNIPTEYLQFDRIYISDADFANATTGIKILSNGISVADYVSAEFKGQIWTNEDSNYIFNSDALNTLDKGISNPWKFKLFVSCLLLVVLLLYVVFIIINKKAGIFKAVLSVAICCFALLALYLFNQNNQLNAVLHFTVGNLGNVVPVFLLVTAFVFILIACVLCDKESKISTRLIIFIYVAMLIFSTGKMVFYNEKVGRTPDEPLHIGYVAYLDQTNDIIPEFDKMPYAHTVFLDNETLKIKFTEGTVNYLRHPPLYYHLMRLSNAVSAEENDTFTVNLDRIRSFNICITIISLALIFYLGFTRVKKIPILHLLYSMIAISVPMLTYCCSGVNNDSFTILTVSVFYWGILRYCENKRNFSTYLLIALGIATTLLTKMTAGIIVLLAAAIVLISTLIREKCWKQLISWQFLITIPLYLLPVAYYLFTYFKYGSFQPELHVLNQDYANSTGFYLPVADRTVQSFLNYFYYFFNNFMHTWTGIFSHTSLPKPWQNAFLENIALILIWVFPLLSFIKPIRQTQKYAKPICAIFIGVLVTVVMQFINGYNGLLNRGYVGGYQSRYYLCAIAMFALCATVLVEKALTTCDQNKRDYPIVKKILICATVVFIGLLAYEDFIYFLVHYNNYL